MIKVINAANQSNTYNEKLKQVYCDTIIKNYSNRIKENRDKEDYKPDYNEIFWLFNKSYYLSHLNEDCYDRESLNTALECVRIVELIHARDKDAESLRFLIDVYAKTGMCYSQIKDYENALKYYHKALNYTCPESKENVKNRINYFNNYLNTVCMYLQDLQDKNDFSNVF